MLNEEMRKFLENIVTALEREWLKNAAKSYLLDQCGPPNWVDLVEEYCQRQASKDQARKRFEPARALIQEAQSDSEALETLVSVLEKTQKAN